MAAKVVVRSSSKPKKAKRAARRATRRAARKASKPRASKRVARKAKRAKRVTKKMQTGSMRQVWNGTKLYTKGGLTKVDLMVNAKNHVMSKKKGALGAKLAKNPKTIQWLAACKRARAELNITGFVKINSGTQGEALYKLAKSYYGN